jgi:hypothetical protein
MAKRSKNRPPEIVFREAAVGELTTEIGVYVLYDLNDVAVYVGQTTAVKENGIKGRVQRHLTSARSDIIANRMIDVWEIAWVRTWPTPKAKINETESALYHELNAKSPLMNGNVIKPPAHPAVMPAPRDTEQVMDTDEIRERLQPSLRLPRQAEHYRQMISHYLNVKDSAQIAKSMNAHFNRLMRYHRELLEAAGNPPIGPTNEEDD